MGGGHSPPIFLPLNSTIHDRTDPITLRSGNDIRPFGWSVDLADGPQTRRVFSEVADFGIRYGFATRQPTIAGFHGPFAKVSVGLEGKGARTNGSRSRAATCPSLPHARSRRAAPIGAAQSRATRSAALIIEVVIIGMSPHRFGR